MTRLGVFGASALALSLGVASPVLAQQQRGGAHPGGGLHAGGVHMGGPRTGGGNFTGSQANANVGRQNFDGRGGSPQFAQRGGQFRGDRGVGPGAAFAAGVAAGSALGYGYGAGYYDPYYYGGDYAYDNGYAYDGGYDSYAYDNGVTFTTGIPLVTFDQPSVAVDQGPVVADASYCAQRYRSYDAASGTYLGYDGLRHPCP